uniref:Uncharacterized protein n=1 Tax=Heterorhabditis bacteriophora TaxID=37862 RepID=A0A1I7WB23_HETBA
MAPRCHRAPEAVQHLSAERSRSVKNYPTPLPKERRELSAESKASAQHSAEEKLTNKLTLLGVFQTHRPSAPKLTAASVDCDLTREEPKPPRQPIPYLSLVRQYAQ